MVDFKVDGTPPTRIAPCLALSNIRLLVCDVDGVMTDGGLYYGEDGQEFRRFHVHDGLGLQHLRAAGIEVAIISRSQTRSISHRAQRLNIPYCFTGVEHKLNCLNQLLKQLDIDLKVVAHIGDDLNDLELLDSVGVPITVPNATAIVISRSQFVTHKAGGDGAIREVTDAILASLTLK